MDDLAIAKKALFDSLGEDFKGYLNLMKLWFKSVLTKEEFDYEATKFLKSEQIKLHNKFLFALFAKCQTLSGAVKKEEGVKSEVKSKPSKSTSKKKPKLSKVTFEHKFIPVNPVDFIVLPAKAVTDADFQPTLIKLTFCSGDGSLPDNFATHLRMFVCVWESGLDGVADDAVRLLNLAIRGFVKNVLMAVLTFKSSYRTRDNGKFKYSIGTPSLNPFLRNSLPKTRFPQDVYSTYTDELGDGQVADIPPTNDLAEQEAMFDIACSSGKSNKRRSQFDGGSNEELVTMWHLYHALKLNKNCIPSHSVYATNMERIIAKLMHDDVQ